MVKESGLLGKFSLFAGTDPQQQELEQAAEAQRRVLMMVKARWALITVLGLYSYFMLLSKGDSFFALVGEYFTVPTVAFAVMIVYNILYRIIYRRFSNLKGVRYFQIILDILFTLVIIHYTGGAESWAWVVLPLIITESAMILDEKWETGLITLYARYSMAPRSCLS